MKKYKYLLLIPLGLLFFSCEFDNYDAPSIQFSGTLKHENEALETKYGTVFKLFQYKEDGFFNAGTASIDVYVNQNGQFNALLFPGKYKMIVNSSGPIYYLYDWKDFPKNESEELDTLYLDIRKKTTLDFEVNPFYQISNFNAFYRNDSIISQFVVKKLTDRTDNNVLFRQVSLFLGTTTHVNNDTPVSGRATPISIVKLDEVTEIKTSLKDYYTDDEKMYVNNYRNYVYTRVGISLRATGQEYIYSNIVKVEGIPQETISKFK